MARIFDLAVEAHRKNHDDDWFSKNVAKIPVHKIVEDAWTSLHQLLTETNIPTKVFHFVYEISEIILDPLNRQKQEIPFEDFVRKNNFFQHVTFKCAVNSPLGPDRVKFYRYSSYHASFTAFTESEVRGAVAYLDEAIREGIEPGSPDWIKCLIDKGNVFRDAINKGVMPDETIWEALEVFEEVRQHGDPERKSYSYQAEATLLHQAALRLGNTKKLQSLLETFTQDLNANLRTLSTVNQCRQFLNLIEDALRGKELIEPAEDASSNDSECSQYFESGNEYVQLYLSQSPSIEHLQSALKMYSEALKTAHNPSKIRSLTLNRIGEVYFFYSKHEFHVEMANGAIECLSRATDDDHVQGFEHIKNYYYHAYFRMKLANNQVDSIVNLNLSARLYGIGLNKCSPDNEFCMKFVEGWASTITDFYNLTRELPVLQSAIDVLSDYEKENPNMNEELTFRFSQVRKGFLDLAQNQLS